MSVQKLNESWAKLFWVLLVAVCLGGELIRAEIIPADRRVDWRAAGVPGGIPDRTTLCATIDATLYGNGTTDATATIQTAIDACPAGQVVYLPEGRYYLAGQVNLTKSDITLRGAGTNRTILLSNSARGFIVGNGNSGNTYIDVVAGAQKGSTQITLSDAAGIVAGDYLVIDEENAQAWITADGHGGLCSWCGYGRCSQNNNRYCPSWEHGNSEICAGDGVCEGGQRTVGHVIRVTAVNGAVLTLEHGLYWGFTYDPQVNKIASMKQGIGLEDLYITKVSETGSHTIEMGYCAGCWIQNVELANTNQRQVHSYLLYHSEFRDSYFHHANCYTGNYGYGFSLQGHVTGVLIENNIFDYMHCPVSFSAAGAGNVVAYNYFNNGRFDYPSCGDTSFAPPRGTTQHGAHPVFILYEGNVLNSMGADFYWGSSSHMTYLRNRAFGFMEDARMNLHAINIPMAAPYYNVVGNVLGRDDIEFIYEVEGVDDDDCWYYPHIYFLGYKDGDTCAASQSDPLVKQTLLRHGNFDYATDSVVWDSAITDHAVPDSYYLSSRPVWWDAGLAWPAFGPTLSHDNKIPAQMRYESLGPTCGNLKPDQTEVRMVVDNRDAVLAGNWRQRPNSQYSYLNDYVDDNGTAGGDPETAATFEFQVPMSGWYQVNFRYQPVWNGAMTPVQVVHRDGTTLVSVDQSTWSQPEEGVDMGRYYFDAGNGGRLIVSAAAEGVTSADSVRLFLQEEEECDDGNRVGGDGCSAICKVENYTCGNDTCETEGQETCAVCPADCGECPGGESPTAPVGLRIFN